MKKYVLFLAVASLVAGCSKPTDAVIPSDMSKWDTELAPKMKELSEEDRQLALGYITRAKLGEAFGGKAIPLGTTLGQGIEEQKKWVAQQAEQAKKEAELKASAAREQAALKAKIDGLLTVALVSKEQLPSNPREGRYSDQQVFKVALKNTGDKPISGVSGTLEFIDIFDKHVGDMSFKIAEALPPGGGTVWTGSRDYNQFLKEHQNVWNLEEGKYTTRFKPDTIVFADGSKISAEPK